MVPPFCVFEALTAYVSGLCRLVDLRLRLLPSGRQLCESTSIRIETFCHYVVRAGTFDFLHQFSKINRLTFDSIDLPIKFYDFEVRCWKLLGSWERIPAPGEVNTCTYISS